MRKLISVRFTAEELYELDWLLANGVFDYDDPNNKVAASAYEKITKASNSALRALRTNGGDK